jgi:hypothetical protein
MVNLLQLAEFFFEGDLVDFNKEFALNNVKGIEALD